MKISTTPSVVIRIVLWILLLGGGSWVSLYYDALFFPGWSHSVPFHLACFVLGAFLLFLSFRAAAAGGRELARSGREGELPRLETNRLVTTGIYACMRHPMLFGLMALPMALGLLLGSPCFVLCTAPAEALFILLMVLTLEEKEAQAKFGEAYRRYARHTPLLPRSHECWRMLFKKDHSPKEPEA